jgi:hypothetical protein
MNKLHLLKLAAKRVLSPADLYAYVQKGYCEPLIHLNTPLVRGTWDWEDHAEFPVEIMDTFDNFIDIIFLQLVKPGIKNSLKRTLKQPRLGTNI